MRLGCFARDASVIGEDIPQYGGGIEMRPQNGTGWKAAPTKVPGLIKRLNGAVALTNLWVSAIHFLHHISKLAKF